MDVNVGWPEGILISFMCIRLLAHAVHNGEVQKEQKKWNFPVELTKAIMLTILLCLGGFFS